MSAGRGVYASCSDLGRNSLSPHTIGRRAPGDDQRPHLRRGRGAVGRSGRGRAAGSPPPAPQSSPSYSICSGISARLARRSYSLSGSRRSWSRSSSARVWRSMVFLSVRGAFQAALTVASILDTQRRAAHGHSLRHARLHKGERPASPRPCEDREGLSDIHPASVRRRGASSTQRGISPDEDQRRIPIGSRHVEVAEQLPTHAAQRT